MNDSPQILADGRWSGPHGIGRFSSEVLARLKNTTILAEGPKPLALKNLLWLPYQIRKFKAQHTIFFTPGFNPVVHSSLPYVLTIHDLTHLTVPDGAKYQKQLYYQTIMRRAVQKAHKILTVSEFSKQHILEWFNISSNKVEVVGSGVSKIFTPDGKKHEPGFPYLLHIGNTKAHKNVARLLQAFIKAKIDKNTHLILTGQINDQLADIIKNNRLQKRIIFASNLSEETLAEYYRGATAVMFPSLSEGFGLPVLEGMASGTPVLTSTTTSLPEVAGNAAVLVNPYEVDSIAKGIEKITTDSPLRRHLITQGFDRAKSFSWDATAQKIQAILLKSQ